MYLYSGFAGADLRSNLLVEHASYYQTHDLPLACGQGQIPRVKCTDFIPLFSRRTVPLECLVNGVQQILVPKRLRKEFHRTRFQGSDRHGYVAVGRNKNDGNLQADICQLALEIESTHLGQPYVQDQATRARDPLLVQKLMGGRKRLCSKSD